MDAAVAEAAGAAKERAGTVSGLRQRVSALATSLEGLKKEIGARRRTVTEAKARLTEFGLAGEAEGRDVTGLLEAETKATSRLAEILDFADGVEVAMDTATTAAALRQQRQGIRERQRRIEETKRDIETNESWRSYFTEVKERIAGKQNAAIASFADEYGPTATAIQERLRSVYGFDGIDTRSHEATIRVRVRRGKEVLRPTDYFSDSQQRTLLLAARGKTPRRAGTGRQWRRNASNQPFIDDFSRYSTHARDQYSTSRVPRDFCHGLLVCRPGNTHRYALHLVDERLGPWRPRRTASQRHCSCR